MTRFRVKRTDGTTTYKVNTDRFKKEKPKLVQPATEQEAKLRTSATVYVIGRNPFFVGIHGNKFNYRVDADLSAHATRDWEDEIHRLLPDLLPGWNRNIDRDLRTRQYVIEDECPVYLIREMPHFFAISYDYFADRVQRGYAEPVVKASPLVGFRQKDPGSNAVLVVYELVSKEQPIFNHNIHSPHWRDPLGS